MKTLLQLAVLAIVGYLFWIYGLPWVQRQVGQSRPPSSNPARGPGGSCVQTAARASEELDDRLLGSTHALMDDNSWDGIVGEVDSALQEARLACACRLESCVEARKAVSTLDSVFAAARNQVQSSQSIPLELGRRYEQANEELWRAYDLAREGH